MFRVSSRQRLVSWDAFDASANGEDTESMSDYETCEEGNGLSRHNSFATFLASANSRSSENLSGLAQSSSLNEQYIDSDQYWCGSFDDDTLWKDWNRLATADEYDSSHFSQRTNGKKKRDRRSITEKTGGMTRVVSFADLIEDSKDTKKNDQNVFRAKNIARGSDAALVSSEETAPLLHDTTTTQPGRQLPSDEVQSDEVQSGCTTTHDWKEEKDIELDDVVDDARIVIFSFLTAGELRIVSETNKANLYLSRSTYLWTYACALQWPLLRNLIEDPTTEHHITFRDFSGIPSAPLSSGFGQSCQTSCRPNLSVLHGMTQLYPTCIDKRFLLPSPYLRYRSRPPEFRAFEMMCSTKSFPERRRTQVLQFTAQVGRGDRCVRADTSFPHVQVSNSRKWCPYAIFELLCRGRGAMTTFAPVGAGSIITAGYASSTKWNLFGITTLKPFVSPFVTRSERLRYGNKSSSGGGVAFQTQLNVTPRLFAYFEISLVERDESQEPPLDRKDAAGDQRRRLGSFSAGRRPPEATASDCVAIGLSTEEFSASDKMPGWDKASYGYHGDDGGIFHSNGDMLRRFGPTFGVGDTVGCGIDYASQGIFFTLNGKFLGYAWTGVDLRKRLYPTVGIDTQCPIECNFGAKPFAFDLKPFSDQHAELIETAFEGFPISTSLSPSASSRIHAKNGKVR